MSEYQLQPNEVIILRSENIAHGGRLASFSNELILTNLNVVFVQKSLLGKSKNMEVFPLKLIKIYNGKAQAVSGSQNGYASLDIFFRDGLEQFRFSNKSEIPRWVNEISKLLTGREADTSSRKIYDPLETYKDSVDSMRSIFGLDPKFKKDNSPVKEVVITKRCISCKAPLTGHKGETLRCEYCDTEQTL
ncbi:MAG: hypothetical protein ACOYBC_10045 [Bilifractor sp.]|jgi:hypothetical protein